MFMLINCETTRGRQHFTIAHELYHLFFEENPIIHICSLESGKNPSEQNADNFASALLMPKQGILPYISKEEIARKTVNLSTVIKLEQYFSVSRLALVYRLKKLNLIQESQISELQKNPKLSAQQFGYELSLYEKGNKDLIIGDFGEKARLLFDQDKISEGNYNQLMSLISSDEQS